MFALALGGGPTAVSRMDFAERGMNGTLAWMQTTGMPMRPAMSTMMAADIPPTEAADTGLDVQLHVPDDTRAGVPTRVTATVVDAETGEPVEDLTRSHQAWMHLIATRDDLATFAHVHPEPTGHPGELAVEVTFPTPGRYIVNTEFRQRGQMADVHQRQLVTVAGVSPAPVAPQETPGDNGRRGDGGARWRGSGRRAQRPALRVHRRPHRSSDRRPATVPRRRGARGGHASRWRHLRPRARRGRGRPRRLAAMPGRRSAPSSMCTPSSTLPASIRCGASSDSPTATCSRCRSPSRRPDPHRRHRPASPRGPVATRQRSSGGEMYDYDVVVIGAGQAGLATGYELGKTP